MSPKSDDKALDTLALSQHLKCLRFPLICARRCFISHFYFYCDQNCDLFYSSQLKLEGRDRVNVGEIALEKEKSEQTQDNERR